LKIISIIHKLYHKSKASSAEFTLKAYSLLYGFIGFLSFLTIIIVAKYINHIFWNSDDIIIDFFDIVLSITGFVLIYIFKRLEQRSKRD